MKRYLILAGFGAMMLAGSIVAAQPQPVPAAPPPAPEPLRTLQLTDGELKATVDMINVCISANPAGCAEAGVIMRKKYEGAMKAAEVPPTAPNTSPVAAVPASPPVSAGTTPIGGNRGPQAPTVAPSAPKN